MTSDAAQLDAIGAHLLAGTWSQAVRRKLQLEWRWDDLRMDDAEGRMRKSLLIEATDPKEREKMRRHIYDLLEEARKLALDRGEDGKGSISAGAAVSAIKAMGELYELFQRAGAAKGAPAVETGDAKSDRDVWLNALAQCPAELLAEFMDARKEARH